MRIGYQTATGAVLPVNQPRCNGKFLPPKHLVKLIHVLERGQLFPHFYGYDAPSHSHVSSGKTATAVDELRVEGQTCGWLPLSSDARLDTFTKRLCTHGVSCFISGLINHPNGTIRMAARVTAATSLDNLYHRTKRANGGTSQSQWLSWHV